MQARAVACGAVRPARLFPALVPVALQLQAARALEVAALRHLCCQHDCLPGGLYCGGAKPLHAKSSLHARGGRIAFFFHWSVQRTWQHGEEHGQGGSAKSVHAGLAGCLGASGHTRILGIHSSVRHSRRLLRGLLHRVHLCGRGKRPPKQRVLQPVLFSLRPLSLRGMALAACRSRDS